MKFWGGTSKIPQWVKVLTTKPYNMSSVPGTHVTKVETHS